MYSTYDVGDVFCLAYSTELHTVYLGAQNTSIQWCDLSRRNALPLNLSLHPRQRIHKFFDSKGPSGVSTPRPILEPELEELGGELLEISKANVIPYAHFGYVHCMVLAQGISTTSPQTETLISGGGDGLIKLWELNGNGDKEALTELAVLENGDNPVLSFALNKTLLYAGCLEGEVNVWDLETRQLIRTVKAHSSDIFTVSVGRGITFTGAADGHCKAFERHQLTNEWKAHDGLVLASALTKYDGKPYLITGGNDGRIAIWNLANFFSLTPREATAGNEQLVQSLSRFVAFRTVSSQPEFAEDCHQGASWLRSLFKQFGATTEMLTANEQHRNPAVLAHFKGKSPKGKRLLFYGHYDVVAAVEGPSKWIDNPFHMQGRDGYVYGRGVSDNKGPILAAIYAVADLIKQHELDNDILFLIEGEEECGSRGFEAIVRKHKAKLGAIQWILVANSYWLSDDFPCLTYGLRGSLHFNLRIQSNREDLHSGVHGSSSIPEPLQDLVAMIAGIRGANGRIQIPEFYDDIPSITDAEEEWYTRISEVIQHENADFEDANSLKARWRQPSFTIHGFKTSSEGGNATVIPHSASVDISFRLVPNQESTRIQKSILKFLYGRFKDLGSSNVLSISPAHPVDPWLGDPENEIYNALEKAVIKAWDLDSPVGLSLSRNGSNVESGDTTKMDEQSPQTKTASSQRPRKSSKSSNRVPATSTSAKRDTNTNLGKRRPKKPLYIREGGSIPAIRFLEKEFGAPAAQLPCGQASDNAHLDNERLRLLNLYNSRKIFRQVFKDVGTATDSEDERGL